MTVGAMRRGEVPTCYHKFLQRLIRIPLLGFLPREAAFLVVRIDLRPEFHVIAPALSEWGVIPPHEDVIPMLRMFPLGPVSALPYDLYGFGPHPPQTRLSHFAPPIDILHVGAALVLAPRLIIECHQNPSIGLGDPSHVIHPPSHPSFGRRSGIGPHRFEESRDGPIEIIGGDVCQIVRIGGAECTGAVRIDRPLNHVHAVRHNVAPVHTQVELPPPLSLHYFHRILQGRQKESAPARRFVHSISSLELGVLGKRTHQLHYHGIEIGRFDEPLSCVLPC
mmetsp:Transcript_25534/g.75248  ORF Transcript_25534/g.75248 Transcript_25534/m.75248 type:complete len:279 (-) Transcript_25534:871-1707(-)